MMREFPRFRRITAPFALGLAALAIGCAEAPITQKYAALRSLDSARKAGAESLAPGWLDSAQEAFEAGESDMKQQLVRLRWNRDFSRAEIHFSSALRRARVAEARATESVKADRRLAESLMSRARSGFRQMEWASSYIPPRSSIRSDVSRARVSFEEADMHFRAGAYPRAVEAARGANQGIEGAYGRFSRLIASHADPKRGDQYERWVRDTIAWSAANGSGAIIVDKMRRTLTLLSSGRRVKTYRAELGLNGTQDKLVSGDRATPEGRYKITEKRGPHQTRWYKALMLNYPNEEDLKRFNQMRRRGQISGRARPGGLIEIHGEGGRGGDWTEGCVALVNRDIDDLFNRVSVGTPVTIVGFDSSSALASLDDRPARRSTSRAERRARRFPAGGR